MNAGVQRPFVSVSLFIRASHHGDQKPSCASTAFYFSGGLAPCWSAQWQGATRLNTLKKSSSPGWALKMMKQHMHIVLIAYYIYIYTHERWWWLNMVEYLLFLLANPPIDEAPWRRMCSNPCHPMRRCAATQRLPHMLPKFIVHSVQLSAQPLDGEQWKSKETSHCADGVHGFLDEASARFEFLDPNWLCALKRANKWGDVVAVIVNSESYNSYQ